MSRTKRWRILRTISHNAELPEVTTTGRDRQVEGK
jgi:hypothetical protein